MISSTMKKFVLFGLLAMVLMAIIPSVTIAGGGGGSTGSEPGGSCEGVIGDAKWFYETPPWNGDITLYFAGLNVIDISWSLDRVGNREEHSENTITNFLLEDKDRPLDETGFQNLTSRQIRSICLLQLQGAIGGLGIPEVVGAGNVMYFPAGFCPSGDLRQCVTARVVIMNYVAAP